MMFFKLFKLLSNTLLIYFRFFVCYWRSSLNKSLRIFRYFPAYKYICILIWHCICIFIFALFIADVQLGNLEHGGGSCPFLGQHSSAACPASIRIDPPQAPFNVHLAMQRRHGRAKKSRCPRANNRAKMAHGRNFQADD